MEISVKALGTKKDPDTVIVPRSEVCGFAGVRSLGLCHCLLWQETDQGHRQLRDG